MKTKRILAAFIFVLCVINSVAVFAEGVSVFLNEVELKYSVEPIIINNRTLVPAEELLNQYNIPYEWDKNSKEFTIKNSEEESIKLTADSSVMLHNTKDGVMEIGLDSNMIVKDNVCYAPIRAVSEAIGYTVDWENDFDYVNIKSSKLTKGEHRLDVYVKYLDKSKDEIKDSLKIFEVYEENFDQFNMYCGTDDKGNQYIFGFMDGIDKCCMVETDIKSTFPGLTEIYESYDSIDRVNIEKYIGTETKLRVDNLYGHYLEYSYNGFSVRVLCDNDGSTGYTVGLYVTQNEPAFLEWVAKEYPVNTTNGNKECSR